MNIRKSAGRSRPTAGNSNRERERAGKRTHHNCRDLSLPSFLLAVLFESLTKFSSTLHCHRIGCKISTLPTSLSKLSRMLINMNYEKGQQHSRRKIRYIDGENLLDFRSSFQGFVKVESRLHLILCTFFYKVKLNSERVS